MSKLDGFEQRELLDNAYWEDKRWKEVEKLRKEGKIVESNVLVFEIRLSYGMD